MMTKVVVTDAAQSKCPICGKPTDMAFRPFCSKRCADVDLSRWLGGVYRIETDQGPDASPDGPQKDDE